MMVCSLLFMILTIDFFFFYLIRELFYLFFSKNILPFTFLLLFGAYFYPFKFNSSRYIFSFKLYLKK